MASSSKKKQIQRMEEQDALGISRKKWKHTLNPNIFILIKLILIALIPITYFLFSPLLILVFIAYIGLFFLARMAEHSMNKSVIRSNHIHISKIDSGIALIIVIIALCGGFMTATKKNQTSNFKGMANTEFSQMRGEMGFSQIKKQMTLNQIKTNLVNIGSLLTGERNLFAKEKSFSFSPSEAPKDFIKDKSELPEMTEDFDPSSFENFDSSGFDGKKMGGGRGRNFDFSMDNIPLEYVSSSTLSTINTILIFSVAGIGLISLFAIYFKKRKFEKEMNEVIVEGKIEMLSDEELTRILSFGEEAEEVKLTQKEINQKIKEEEAMAKKKKIEPVDTSNITDLPSFDQAVEGIIEILDDTFKFKE